MLMYIVQLSVAVCSRYSNLSDKWESPRKTEFVEKVSQS